MWAQRRGLKAPPFIRARLVRTMEAGAAALTVVDGWDTPIVGTGPLGPPPEPRAVPAPDSGTIPPSVSAAPVRCLITAGDFDVSGAAEGTAILARRLPEYGIETAVAFTKGPPLDGDGPAARVADSLAADGIEILEIGERAQAQALLSEQRFDLVHGHGAPIWWADVAHEHGVPMVDAMHGGLYMTDFDWADEPRRSSRLVRVLAISDFIRDRYLMFNPSIDPAKVVTIDNCVDDRRLRDIDRDAARRWLGLTDEFLFLSLGRYTQHKNVYGLVAAFGEVAATRPSAHLLVAGRNDDAAFTYRIQQLRDDLPGRARIHLRGHSPAAPTLLAAADCFVMDSFFEGGPRASMEALCAGVPVILADTGTARMQLDGGLGIVVGNPVGEPQSVMPENVKPLLFAREQANTAELVAAMQRMVDERDQWRARAGEIAGEARRRFATAPRVAEHAALVRECAGTAARA